jgi:V-type H+-transporting ATPase subunit C
MSSFLVTTPIDADAGVLESLSAIPHVEAAFSIPRPPLRIESLNVFLSVAEQAARAEASIHSTAQRIERLLSEIVPDFTPIVGEDELSRAAFLRQFEWDSTRFPISRSLPENLKGIMDAATSLDSALKTQSADYATLAARLANLKRRDTGPVTGRSLVGLLAPSHIVDTEHLTTVLVVVPPHRTAEFADTYEAMAQMVVPGSYEEICRDTEGVLISVVVVRKCASDFLAHARSERYAIRPTPTVAELEDPLQIPAREMADADAKLEAARTELEHWGWPAYADALVCAAHASILRAFAEGATRHGVPPTFGFVVVTAKTGKERKVIADVVTALKEAELALHAASSAGPGSEASPFMTPNGLTPNGFSLADELMYDGADVDEGYLRYHVAKLAAF